MARQSCLTPDELRAFNLGELPEGVLEEFAAHLEGCPRCEAAANDLDTLSDDVLAAYRQSALAAPLAEPARPPERVGEYEILGEVGRGGMGVVYQARHQQLQRVVALKMLLGGSFVTSEERARFRAEAEAVARLRHPNIVQIYEIGEYDVGDGHTRPYFTLEFASGGSLSSRMAGRPQSPRQAAAWLQALARAAHYAHQQGIIHRDLKPSNVLLTEQDEPKICDFGVAKLMTGSDVKTRSGTLLGTAEYMAPEQAVEREQVGPAADVYALGAILYAVLTGRPPFQGSSTLHILEQVRSQEPVPLRRLLPHLPRDLETICLKCLQKEPARRYLSAWELADDLERFLEGRPIVARPISTLERSIKWVRRRPVEAGLVAAIVMLAVLGIALIVVQWRSAEARVQLESNERKIAQEKEQEEARGRRENLQLLTRVTLDHGLNLCDRGEVNHGLLHLARALSLAVEAEADDLERLARVNLAVWRRRLVTPRAELRHDGWVWAVAFSPDGRTALTGGKDCMARRWDVRTGKPKGEPLRHRHPVWSVAYSPDGRTILTGSGDDQVREGEARLWDAASGEPLGPPLPHPDEVHGAVFSPDGRRFLAFCDEEVCVWRFDRGRPADRLVLPHPRPKQRLEKIQPRLSAVFSPDSRLVLTGGEDGTARLWDAATGAARGEPLHHDGPVLALAFSPDGSRVLTGSYDGTARLWDVATCRQHGPDLTHLGSVHAVTFRSDNEFIATASSVEDHDVRTGVRTPVGGEVRLWRAKTGERFGEPMRHSQPVGSVAFRPGGGKLLAGGRDRAARFYSVFDGTMLGKPLDHEGTVANVVFSRNGRLALTASAGGDNLAHARLWELAPGDPVVWSEIAERFEGKGLLVSSFASDGKRMLGIAGSRVREFDAVSGQAVGPVLEHPQWVRLASYSPDGQTILTIGSRYTVRFWDRASGRQVGPSLTGTAVNAVSYSADGKYLAISRADHTVSVYRTPSGELWGPVLKLPESDPVGFFVHPDGRTGLSYDGSDQVREWDVRTKELLHVRKVPGSVRRLCFVGDKAVVVTGEGRHLARAWELETGRPMSGPLADITGSVSTLTFSPDGRTILTGLWDRRSARLWDAATGKPIGPPVHHSEAVPVVAFTADGKRMMSGSVNGEFRSQEVPAPVTGDVERIRCWVEVLTGMEMDARGAIWDLDPETLAQRRQRLLELGGPPDRVDRP
jgi:WD40 repeat protein/serine/threonine protein kinase